MTVLGLVILGLVKKATVTAGDGNGGKVWVERFAGCGEGDSSGSFAALRMTAETCNDNYNDNDTGTGTGNYNGNYNDEYKDKDNSKVTSTATTTAKFGAGFPPAPFPLRHDLVS
jgi:hypothetical protein